MMNTFYLIRHGNIPNTPGDPHLTSLGTKQAKYTALSFKNKPITKIYCSTSNRARDTARIFANKLNTIENLDDRLRERFYWGDDPSQSFEEFMEEWKKTMVDRDYKPLIGDSSRSAGERFSHFLDELATDKNNQQIILVAHGGVIMDLLRNLFDDEYLKSFSPNFLNAGIGECSLSELILNNGVYTLKQFDSAAHLPRSLQLRSPGW